MRRAILILAAVALVLLAAAVVLRGPERAVPVVVLPVAAGEAERGAAGFAFGDFGGLSATALETHAVPWRLAVAALVLDGREGEDVAAIMARFGFLSPETIGNWPKSLPPPQLSGPLGLTQGDLPLVRGVPVRIANLGCAACHAGPTYDAAGRPRPERAWLGSPNTSLDLEAYTGAVFRAMRRGVAEPERLFATVDKLYPEMGVRERFALKNLVFPRVRDRLAALGDAETPLPFPNGTPGRTNGVAALKQVFGLPLAGGGAGETGSVSIPDLGHRTVRTSLLADGAYAVPGVPRARTTVAAHVDGARLDAQAAIVTFFTVPSMGVPPAHAIDSLDEARAVMRFLDGYRPQPFPRRIDERRAAAGHGLYRRHCAACHGDRDAGGRMLSFPNWSGDVGTDPARARLFTPTLARAVASSAYGQRIAAAATGRYAAPPLTGLWASAPYLHNGSVPTVAALLDPARRPRRFLTGGHALDFTALGLRLTATGGYPAGYRPWSTPAWIDTQAPGLGNEGHAQGTELAAGERAALIEFLKRL